MALLAPGNRFHHPFALATLLLFDEKQSHEPCHRFGHRAYQLVALHPPVHPTPSITSTAKSSLLKPILDEQLQWTNEQFGQVNSVFQGAYALSCSALAGWSIASITRPRYAISIVFWRPGSHWPCFVAAWRFFLARGALGSVKAATSRGDQGGCHLFPKRERAYATSLFTPGTNVWAIVAARRRSLVRQHLGLAVGFIAAGIAGFLGSSSGSPFTTSPARSAASPAPRWSTSTAIPRKRSSPARPSERPSWITLLGYRSGLVFHRRQFRPTRSGGSSSSGCPTSSRRRAASTSSKRIHLVSIYGDRPSLSIAAAGHRPPQRKGASYPGAQYRHVPVCPGSCCRSSSGPRQATGGGCAHRIRRSGPPGLVGKTSTPPFRQCSPSARWPRSRNRRHGRFIGGICFPVRGSRAGSLSDDGSRRHRRHAILFGICGAPTHRLAINHCCPSYNEVSLRDNPSGSVASLRPCAADLPRAAPPCNLERPRGCRRRRHESPSSSPVCPGAFAYQASSACTTWGARL